jgi:hypothetical protein
MSLVTAIHYDPRLMEDALFHAQRQGQVSAPYQQQRNRVYEIPDPDERDRLFDELNRVWFIRLKLDRVIACALKEQPLILRHIANCFVAAAAQAKGEGAELFIAADPAIAPTVRRTLRILIRPESLLRQETLTQFLRHELMHIADMLDPVFAYEPALPVTEGGPIYDTLITNRYRVLWDVTIDGRMTRHGWYDPGIRERDFRDFLVAFPMLGESASEVFQVFFDAIQPRHSELAAFALKPRATVGHHAEKIAAGTHCALCRFPTHSFEPAPQSLAADILTEIHKDFPQWSPAQGLCLQCADLYRARNLSISAAKLLPGGVQNRHETDALRAESVKTASAAEG